ncbi:hypothetical protein JDV02_004814 [Purpureocillium takamizusanense]|uniref:Uncharacterized protein n=1 Tax=Purpureocillium takamizusanense TaxID=2060973 RepID=A0A9Q8QG18_9HYPO|nr:uncharacterized protein JDV02_004814 [Purpureocillium takamizusanense]UNI18551.1 hypothetical protein JDV02_004814 [Purpureocillium takamizusanense]
MNSRYIFLVALLNGFARGSDFAPVPRVAIAAPTATTPPPALPTLVERQNIDSSCVSSVISELSPPTGGLGSDFLNWASSASSATPSPNCTITAPASIYHDFTGYRDELRTYFSTIASKASGIDTDCGADSLSLTFDEQCTTSLTVYFTGSSGCHGPFKNNYQELFRDDYHGPYKDGHHDSLAGCRGRLQTAS